MGLYILGSNICNINRIGYNNILNEIQERLEDLTLGREDPIIKEYLKFK